MSDFSVIYCTCDNYFDLSDNFFILLRKYWPEFKDKVYFNSDCKEYNNDYYEIVNVKHSIRNASWSQRLFDALKMIDTEYVLLFLDDFYLESRVDNDEFNRCLLYLKNHKKVQSIAFTKEPGLKRKLIPELGNFAYRKHFSTYKITAHIALYKTSFLKNILKRKENAWEFEVNGTIRSFFKRGSFVSKTNREFTFPYHYGLLVRQGKYDRELKKHFEEFEKLTFRVERPCIDNENNENKGKSKIYYLTKGLLSIFSKKPI